MRFYIGIIAATLWIGTGCASSPENEGAEGAAADSTEAGQEAPEEYEYTIYLTGALSDTLQGDATFGRVMQAGTNRMRLLIELKTGSDFTGGFFINLGDTMMPSPGTFSLDQPVEGEQANSNPVDIVYRRGLIINLASFTGSLTLDTVTDTLITGSFTTRLQGEVRTPEVYNEEGEVAARGEFEARPGGIGFIVGL